jgi:hypothetical protein
VGGNAVLFERINVFVHGVYADDFKPRVGIGFQF